MATRRETLVAELKALDVDDILEVVRELQTHVNEALELDPDLSLEQHEDLARAYDDAKAGRNMVRVDNLDEFLDGLMPAARRENG